MPQTLRAERPVDHHPTREQADHANIDPRQPPKHPKVSVLRAQPLRRSERPAA